MVDLNIPGNEGEKIQQVEFEPLYTGLREVNDISQIQSKLLIDSPVFEQIPLFFSLNLYSSTDPDPCYNRGKNFKILFKTIFPDIALNSRFYDGYYPHNDLKGNVISIKKCYENNNDYFFISDSGCYFVVKKQDFLTNGYMAKSLKLLSDNNTSGNGEVDISDSDGTVKYYFGGTLEGTLQGSCFTYLNKSSDNNAVDAGTIYVGNGSSIYKTKFKVEDDLVINKKTVHHYDDESIDLSLGKIKKLILDPKKNLLFVISENEEGDSSLHILEHKKLFNTGERIKREIKTMVGISDINILSDGDIVLYKSDGSVDILNTNLNSLDDSVNSSFEMKKIKVSKAIDQTRQQVLDSLGGFTLSWNTEEISNEGDEQDKEIMKQIWGKPIDGIGKTFKELFDEANSEDDISLVQKVFYKIKNRFPQITDMLKKIEKQIIDKKNTIILDSIFSELGDISTELGNFQDLPTLITIKTKLMGIQKKRRNVQAGIVAQDKDLKQLLETVNQKILECKEESRNEIQARIDDNLDKIQDILSNIDYSVNISSIYKDETYQETEDLIPYLSIALQEKYKKALRNLVNNRRNEIKKEIEAEKEKESKVIEDKRVEVEEYIEEIKEVLDDIDDVSTVEQYKENDVLVEKIKKLLEELPSSIAQTLDLKLDRIFGERIFTLRLNGEETKGVVQNLDSYGIDTILYYNEDGSEQVEWKIEGKEKPDGKISLVVKLINGETHEYDKSLYLRDFEKYGDVTIRDWNIKFDMTEEEFSKYSRLLSKWKKTGKQEIKTLMDKIAKETNVEKKEQLQNDLKNKKEYYKDARYTELLIKRLIKQQKLNPRSKVPPFDPDFIVLDEEKEILKNLSTRLIDQKQNGGIDILEGGPGLGKTVMCEFLAQVTNREIIRVQCSKMDPSDMFFSPTLKKGETSREPADWIKLMQKPGTIILFDEIDKLNDQCFERLHSLFDRSRSVYDPQLGKVKANSNCLFLGTRNSYDRMSNPILSRGRILQVNYPGVLNESYKVSKYTDSSILKKMSFEEFTQLYDKYITRSESAPSNARERKIYDLMKNIYHLLNVFTDLRSMYDSDEPFAFEISYRDARQIFVDYNSSGDFKKSMENILIPKARGAVIDPDDKKDQEEIVRNAINKEIQ